MMSAFKVQHIALPAVLYQKAVIHDPAGHRKFPVHGHHLSRLVHRQVPKQKQEAPKVLLLEALVDPVESLGHSTLIVARPSEDSQ